MLFLFALGSFASAFAIRVLDPLTLEIAADMNVSAHDATIVAVVFAMALCASQPVWGIVGDALGKERILRLCSWLLALSLLAGALAQNLPQLMAARIVSGIGAGGVIPLILALIGDRYGKTERAIALSRVVACAVLGQLAGAVAAGIVGSSIGWRWVLVGVAALGLCAALALLLAKSLSENRKPPRPVDAARIVGDYRTVFSNRVAALCFLAVFFEGLCVFGAMPFIVLIFPGATALEAGIVIGGVAVGGVAFAVFAPQIVRRLSTDGLIFIGCSLAAFGLVTVAAIGQWQLSAAAMVVTGFGYSMMHNELQTTVTGLLPDLRGTVVSTHALFFWMGQAAGPLLFGLNLALFGSAVALTISAAALLAIGLGVATGLRRRSAELIS